MTRPVALVTGARGSLGHALVRRLGEAGYDVIAHSRTPVDGAAGTWLVGDLSDQEVARGLAANIECVDLLVNNAADQSVGRLDELSAGDWSAMIGATLMSAVNLSAALRHRMPAGACIVNISSVEAQAPFPGHAHYAAAKAALESYTRSAATEWASSGIRVNAVAPGLIDRPGLEADWPDGYAWWVSTCPLGRALTPDEVVDAVLLLTAATGVSGAVVPVDGGWSASARRM